LGIDLATKPLKVAQLHALIDECLALLEGADEEALHD
jgi:hypothetical protein